MYNTLGLFAYLIIFLLGFSSNDAKKREEKCFRERVFVLLPESFIIMISLL